jgi:hypothetical protein
LREPPGAPGRSGAFSSVVRSFMRRSLVDCNRADKLAAAREFASANVPQSSAFKANSHHLGLARLHSPGSNSVQ